MVGWIILAVLAILILLVFFLPYGVDVGYADEVLRVGIKAGPLRIWLLPKKPLTEKQRLCGTGLRMCLISASAIPRRLLRRYSQKRLPG